MFKGIVSTINRIHKAIENNEKVILAADVDPDGICSTTLMYQYLRRITNNVKIIFHERGEGHGIGSDRVPPDTDLLIIIDSSSSEAEECKKLKDANSNLDIIVLDHHNLERENPYVTLVNPQQDGCFYPNKNGSATLVTFKIVEMLDYKFKKVDIRMFYDLVGLSLLSDSMNMRELENRYFVSQLLNKVSNIGLMALIHETKNNNKDLNAHIFNFDIIPCLNTATRNDNIKQAFLLMLETDFEVARKKAKQLVKDNKARKDKVNELMRQYESKMEKQKFIFVTDPNATKNYNGLVAQKLATKYMSPAMVLKETEDNYQGSYRSYDEYPLQSLLKTCPYVEYAAGHQGAGGIEVKKANWKKFQEWVDQNFEQPEVSIRYDLELSESELDWDTLDIIQEFDRIYGQGFPKISVCIKNVFVHERNVFPQKSPNHIKVVAEGFDILKFNEPEYGENIDSFDVIDVIGTVGLNEWNGNRKIQVFMDDYIKNSDMEMVN